MNIYLELFFLIIICAVAVGGFLQFRMHKHVSREKVHAIDDVTTLWRNSVPPKEVLNEKGLKLNKYYRACLILIVVCGFAMFLWGAIGLFNA